MDITNKLKESNLLAEMESVLKNLITIERSVKTENGRSYIMRVAPYRTLDDRIDGLVITLVDITALTQAEEEVRRAGEELEHRVDARTQELAASNQALIKEAGERSIVEGQRVLLIEQLVRAQEDERRRLARDLHDQFGQQLTALRLKLESLKRSPGLPTAQQATVNELQSILQRLDTDVDFLAWELRPLALDDLGLAAALSNYVKEWSEHFEIPVNFHSTGMADRRLQPGLESNLYRIAQEALNNCARHSGCSQASVILEARDEQVALIVEDNGTGFDSQETGEVSRQMGLLGMRERAALMGGSFEIESSPTDGTTIFVRAPLAGESGKNDG
jgi:signal transduction histidine kinase